MISSEFSLPLPGYPLLCITGPPLLRFLANMSSRAAASPPPLTLRRCENGAENGTIVFVTLRVVQLTRSGEVGTLSSKRLPNGRRPQSLLLRPQGHVQAIPE
jgi:hypothetical protein